MIRGKIGMTKTFKMAAVIAALMLPGAAMAATDGTLGSTSTGTFTASTTANPPVGTQVLVAGLQDFSFAPVTIAAEGTSGAQTVNQQFCIARSTQGDVRVEVRQTGISDGKTFELNLGNAGPEFIPVTGFSVVQSSSETPTTFPIATSGAGFNMHNPPTSCPQPSSVARIDMTIPTSVGPEFAGAGGNFSGQFTLLVSPL
jgi:hypothetical protein